MDLTKISKVFGVVLVAIGLMGFIPALTPDGHLLGLFHVDTLHNLVHLSSGALALLAGFSSESAAKLYFKVFGVVYALVAVLGFVYGDNDILGLLANNIADALLHVVIAGSALFLGFGSYGRAVDTK